ncbi:MAG: C10 family peptidase, partial [Bacteroidales bacterium]|nr:C10 family peptidase [Bacteroidales bacterium]
MSGYLDDLAAQIAFAVDSALVADQEILDEWDRYSNKTYVLVKKMMSPSAAPRAATNLPDSVDPLLTTTWDQGKYYNALCPMDVNGPDGHALTGCVATAMAQIINYWGYPVHGRGTHSYTHNDYGTLTVNYDSAHYDYANMPSVLTSTSTAPQVNAVAKLMYDCGVAANMGYGPNSSSSFDVDARAGLINFFRFSSDLSFAEKVYFSTTEWTQLLCQNLAAKRPVMYGGNGTGGHSFVCDGYKPGGYFHFNFGWSGNSNGWYLTNAVNPGLHNFSSSQSALVGLVPDSTGNIILGQMDGTSTFMVDHSMEFYHIMGHNDYEGDDYSNSCNNYVLFMPSDTSKQLVLDVISFENQNVTVFDSIFGNRYVILSPDTVDPFVSTCHALTLLYQGYFSRSGFQLCISQDNGCRMVSNVTASVDTTTIHLSWKENGSAAQWQIEYGLKGFKHGEGTMVTVQDTTVGKTIFQTDVMGLKSFREYDIYIRSMCDTNQAGPWYGIITVMSEARYWTDVVTSKPAGYAEDSLGNVTVSTAEGLAWWAKQYMVSMPTWYNTKHPNMSIVDDIDLDGYLWKPVRYYSGNINGGGHIIENMHIIEHEKQTSGPYMEIFYCGFIDDYYGDTIQNIRFVNPFVKSPRDNSGVIVGNSTNECVLCNCCVINGYVEGGFYVGLIIGFGAKTINNCYATGNVYADGFAGGISGSGAMNFCNCWTDINTLHVKTYIGQEINEQAWNGLITAYLGAGNAMNCFYSCNSNISQIELGGGYDLPLTSIFGYYVGTGTIENVSGFVANDSSAILSTPVLFDTTISDLVTALNAWVLNQNSSA